MDRENVIRFNFELEFPSQAGICGRGRGHVEEDGVRGRGWVLRFSGILLSAGERGTS